MNTPTHIVSGACVALAIAHGNLMRPGTLARAAAMAMACFVAGVATHLLLDLLPHYAWVVYLDWFKPLPYHWLIREAAFGIAVAFPAFIWAGKAWPFVALGMVGGMYPDLEKVLALDFRLPAQLVLFDWHSTYLSSRTAGLPRPLLIVMECCLIAAFLLVLKTLSRGASNRAPHPSPVAAP